MLVNTVLTCYVVLLVRSLYQRFPQDVDMFFEKSKQHQNSKTYLSTSTSLTQSTSFFPQPLKNASEHKFCRRPVIFCLASCAQAFNVLRYTLRACMSGAFL